jgi:hypothetical protein
MKRHTFCLLLFFVALFSNMSAQQKNIIQELESPSLGGTVVVGYNPAIAALFGTPDNTEKDAAGFMKMNGFRIQVFMGSNHRSAREEAVKKESLLKEKFPELSTYVIYDAPNWKFYAGDFLTKDEAMLYRQQIQKAFPEFGKEIYTVIDKVNVPVYSPVE